MTLGNDWLLHLESTSDRKNEQCDYFTMSRNRLTLDVLL
jgi:hypothetical protein